MHAENDGLGAKTAEITLEVTPENTAASLATQPGEHYPAVFATPFMIAAMERACAAILRPLLKPGELSVGVKMEVSHLAPTAVGEQVVAAAHYESHEAPLHWFTVTASDRRGVIGKGRMARAIVLDDDLVRKAADRARA
jgi:predicted thioesterase